MQSSDMPFDTKATSKPVFVVYNDNNDNDKD